jgi:hypothetical protein
MPAIVAPVAGTMRKSPETTPDERRKDSLITAFKYGNDSNSFRLGSRVRSGQTLFNSALSLDILSAFMRRRCVPTMSVLPTVSAPPNISAWASSYRLSALGTVLSR